MNLAVFGPARAVAVVFALNGLFLTAQASAQTTTPAVSPSQPAVSVTTASPLPSTPTFQPPSVSPVSPAAVVKASIRVPEGTEVRIAIDDPLSSKTSSAGDVFAFRTTETIRLPDGTVLPEGYRGRGEVTDVEKKGMLGKAGQLKVRLDYFSVGDIHVHLRRSTGVEGKSGVGTTVALVLIVSPLFLMHHGAEAVIPKGQAMTAFVDEDTLIANPPPPPNVN